MQELPFKQSKGRRGPGKCRQLVHAVVHPQPCLQVPGERQRHRRVVPDGADPEAMPRDELIDQRPLHPHQLVGVQMVWQLRTKRDDVLGGRLNQEVGRRGPENRLLKEEDPAFARSPGQQVLRSLVDPVPPEMGEAQEVVGRHRCRGERHGFGTGIGHGRAGCDWDRSISRRRPAQPEPAGRVVR